MSWQEPVTTVRALPPRSVDLPSDIEADKLLSLVGETYPQLRSSEPDHTRHFVNALRFLGTAYRSKKFSPYAVTAHLDACLDWLSHANVGGGTSLSAFYSAAIVSHVRFSAGKAINCALNKWLALSKALHG